MSSFTSDEIAYLANQPLGRLATVGPGGQPQVVPVSFRYNPEHDSIDISGHGFAKRKKWRDVHSNPLVAFVVDDIASVQPWVVRGVEIRGKAEPLLSGGKGVMQMFDEEMFRIHPTLVRSWGLNRQ